MFGTLADVFATICIKFLNNYLARLDLKDSVRKEMENDVLQLALVAAQWKAVAAARPDGGATLGVRPDSGQIVIPGLDPPTPGSPSGD